MEGQGPLGGGWGSRGRERGAASQGARYEEDGGVRLRRAHQTSEAGATSEEG